MFDFSLTDLNADHLSPLAVVYALFLSFILACLISFTYQRTTKDNQAPGHFIQAMILGSIIASIVTIAIGDSIGRGLGMLGIMAMIRFRTNITQPRNMIFMFSSLGVGIACGVFAFNIGIYGSLFFCLIAFALHISPYDRYPRKNQTLRISFSEPSLEAEHKIKVLFMDLGIHSHLVRVEKKRVGDKFEKECQWELERLSESDYAMVFQKLVEIIPSEAIRLSMRYEDQII